MRQNLFGRINLDKKDWMIQLWQPLMDRILLEYNGFTSRKSKCNVVLLTTDHDFFSEFRKYFLEKVFGSKMKWLNVMSGAYFKSRVRSMNETVFFLSDMVGWITDKNADKSERIRSLRKLIDSAKVNNKFLILCGYDFMLPRFYEYLQLAYINSEIPPIKEMRLEAPS